MSTCIVVLGGHRCGTSAVAGVLHHLGVFMGYRFVGAGKYNKRGHWEDKVFLGHHKRIVGSWKNPKVDFEPHRQVYSRLVRRREEEHELWGFKDPRTIFMFPYFLEVVKVEVRVINVWRNLEASAKSMTARHSTKSSRINVDMGEARIIAELYRREQMQVLEDWEGAQLNVKYERLCQRPHREVIRIAQFVGLSLTERAVKFIAPKLRHF